VSRKFILKELSRYKLGTYADIVYRNAILYSNEEAFKYGSERVTFAQFNAKVNSLIHALKSMGVEKGDVLGILSWNCLEYTDVYGAAMKGGFIASPFNPRLQENELDYIINYSEANTLFVGPELVDIANSLRPRLPKVKNFISFEGPAERMICHRELLSTYPKDEPDIQVEEDDPVFIFYTSGTTGIPRGGLYNHRHALSDTRTCIITAGLQPGDRHVQIMPLFHIGGSKTFWGYFCAGGSNVILKFFDPEVTLKTIQDERATDIHIVPTHLGAFFSLPNYNQYNLSSLKRMLYAASPMPFELLKKGLEVWGNIFIQFYGSSETGPYVSCLRREDHNVLDKSPEEQRILLSCGQPNFGVQVRILNDRGEDVEPGEVGEITVRGNTIIEFWKKPEDTREIIREGWVHTGDMGRYDEKGYIYILDRKKDMIVSGGENVYPREVEEILYQHPAVKEAAVIGIPDPYWVERVHAVVVLKEGTSVTSEELIDFCKKRIARYKAPKSIEFVKSLPKTPSGKILKRELREKYWAGMERRV
jgi:acyl-CoA synthetase (AMP-forming)/AMP-acid ligase II